jgi:ankyrin repeat protein
MLIERGADPTAQNKDGEAPLHLALRRLGINGGPVEAVHMLIDRGADVTAQTKKGKTPLLVALIYGGKAEVARMLIERGADPTAQNKDGDTLLHLASRMGQVEVAHMHNEPQIIHYKQSLRITTRALSERGAGAQWECGMKGGPAHGDVLYSRLQCLSL